MNALLPRLFGDITDWFEEVPPRLAQLIRIEDLLTDQQYTLRAELPAIDPEKDVQITVAKGILAIHAERREETEARHRSEFRYGALHRSVRLPANADEEHVTATYSKGILEVTVPLLPAEPAGRQIPIATGE